MVFLVSPIRLGIVIATASELSSFKSLYNCNTAAKMPVSLILSNVGLLAANTESGVSLNLPPGPRCPSNRLVNQDSPQLQCLAFLIACPISSDPIQATLLSFLSELAPAAQPTLSPPWLQAPLSSKSIQTVNPMTLWTKFFPFFEQTHSFEILRSRGRQIDY